MFKIKVNQKSLKRLDSKLNEIANRLPQTVAEGIEDALKNIQATAIRISRNSTGILVEMVEMNTGKVKGRVYTDKETFSYAPFEEYGTGEYAELPHIGTTSHFKETGYTEWYIPVGKVERALNYPKVKFGNSEFYVAHGVKPKPFMTPAGNQTREQNVEIVKKKIQEMLKEVCK